MLKSFTIRFNVDLYTDKLDGLIDTLRKYYDVFVFSKKGIDERLIYDKGIIVFKGDNIVGYFNYSEEEIRKELCTIHYLSPDKQKEFEEFLRTMVLGELVEPYGNNIVIHYFVPFHIDKELLRLKPEIIVEPLSKHSIESLYERSKVKVESYKAILKYKVFPLYGRLSIVVETTRDIEDGIMALREFFNRIWEFIYKVEITVDLLRPM